MQEARGAVPDREHRDAYLHVGLHQADNPIEKLSVYRFFGEWALQL